MHELLVVGLGYVPFKGFSKFRREDCEDINAFREQCKKHTEHFHEFVDLQAAQQPMEQQAIYHAHLLIAGCANPSIYKSFITDITVLLNCFNHLPHQMVGLWG